MKIDLKFFPRSHGYELMPRDGRRGVRVKGAFGPTAFEPPCGSDWCGDGMLILPRSLAQLAMQVREWKVTLEFESPTELRTRVAADVCREATDKQIEAIARIMAEG